MKFDDFISNPYAFNLAVSNSGEIQSKAFDRSVNIVAKIPFIISYFSKFLDHH